MYAILFDGKVYKPHFASESEAQEHLAEYLESREDIDDLDPDNWSIVELTDDTI